MGCVQLARICPPVGENPRLLCSSSSPSPKYQRTKLLLLPGWLCSFMPPFPLSMPQQVVCRILENASPLPCAQSADYLILKADGSAEQVSGGRGGHVVPCHVGRRCPSCVTETN